MAISSNLIAEGYRVLANAKYSPRQAQDLAKILHSKEEFVAYLILKELCFSRNSEIVTALTRTAQEFSTSFVAQPDNKTNRVTMSDNVKRALDSVIAEQDISRGLYVEASAALQEATLASDNRGGPTAFHSRIAQSGKQI